MDKRDMVDVFHERLRIVIERSGLSRTQFAQSLGLDRSTLSQILSKSTVRLPRSETIAAIAAQYQVSLDWLLGLSQQDQVATDIVPQLEVADDASLPTDERVAQWHNEAAGYKIRYVPATLPDLLKTRDVIEYEFANKHQSAPRVQYGETEARLAYSRKPETDMEICCSSQLLVSFARGEGVWSGLTGPVRRTQIEWMIELLDELYPTLRWFLFDGLAQFAAPYTVFGPQRAAIYIGDMFFVFNATEHIRVLTRHFDALIRSAVVQPNECADYLQKLLAANADKLR